MNQFRVSLEGSRSGSTFSASKWFSFEVADDATQAEVLGSIQGIVSGLFGDLREVEAADKAEIEASVAAKKTSRSPASQRPRKRRQG